MTPRTRTSEARASHAPAGRRRPTRDSPLAERAPVVIRRLKRAYPDAHVALKFSNPLECLVATILSAQCTDERVNQVTQGPNGLFARYPTPLAYLEVPESQLAADIRPTGFFNNKTRSIRGAARRLVEEYDGKVPETMAELITLPGVARKTANIVQGNSYPARHRRDRDAGIAVDTHVRRVSRRLGFSETDDPEKVEQDLMRIVPKREWFSFTYVLIEHGRRVCKAPTPRCEVCPVSDLCPSSRV